MTVLPRGTISKAGTKVSEFLSPFPETRQITSFPDAQVALPRVSVPSLPYTVSQEDQQPSGQNKLGHLGLYGNSLENFKFELHPEEELGRRG